MICILCNINKIVCMLESISCVLTLSNIFIFITGQKRLSIWL